MADIDANTLELLERRIGEKVAENVERSLKWRYGTALAVFVAVTGLVGWSIKVEVEKQIASVAKNAEADMAEAVQRAESRTDELLDKTEMRVRSQLETLDTQAKDARLKFQLSEALTDEVAKRVARNMDQVDERVRSFDAKVAVLTQFGGRVDDLDHRSTELDLKIKDGHAQTDARLAKLNDMVADVGRVADMDRNLATLAQQVAAMQTAMQQVASAAPAAAPAPAAYASVRSALQGIVSESGRRTEAAAKPADEARTVFVQFAGGLREQAKSLSEALRRDGYVVPGEERTAGAAGQREVRYFHDSDRASATELVRAVNAALVDLGYGVTVAGADFTGYRKLKPRPGTLELWLEMPPSRPAAG